MLAGSCPWKEKRKWKLHGFLKIFGIFNMLFTSKVHIWGAILVHVGGENKKKLTCHFFFLSNLIPAHWRTHQL